MDLVALRPLRQGPFARFWLAGLASSVGGWMQTAALGIYAADSTGKAAWVAVVVTMAFLSTGLLALVGGTLADKYPRRLVYAAVTFGQATVAGGIALAFALGSPPPLLLAGFSFAVGALVGLSASSHNTLIADLVPGEQVPQAYSLDVASWNLARTLGPAFAVAAISFGSYATVFSVNAALSVVLAVVLNTLPTSHEPAPDVSTVWQRLRTGVAAVRSDPTFRLPLGIGVAEMAFIAPFLALVPAMAQLTLGGTAVDTGRLFLALGIGSVVGALGGSSLVPRLGEERTLRLVVTSACVVGVAYAWSPNVLVAMALIFVLGGLHASAFAGAVSLMQRAAAPAVRGRAMSVFTCLTTVAYALTTMALARVADVVGLRPMLTAAYAVCLLVTAVIFSRARQPAAVSAAQPVDTAEASNPR